MIAAIALIAGGILRVIDIVMAVTFIQLGLSMAEGVRTRPGR